MMINSKAVYSFEIGTYSISASPKDLKDVQFAVWKNNGDKRTLGDNYFINYWMYQVNDRLNTFLKTEFPDNAVSVKMVIQNDPFWKDDLNEKVIPPSYDEVKDQLAQGTYVFIHFNQGGDVPVSDKFFDDMLSIFNFLKNNKYSFQFIDVNYGVNKNSTLNYNEFYSVKESQDIKRYLEE